MKGSGGVGQTAEQRNEEQGMTYSPKTRRSKPGTFRDDGEEMSKEGSVSNREET